jgi:hypothetical protein
MGRPSIFMSIMLALLNICNANVYYIDGGTGNVDKIDQIDNQYTAFSLFCFIISSCSPLRIIGDKLREWKHKRSILKQPEFIKLNEKMETQNENNNWNLRALILTFLGA